MNELLTYYIASLVICCVEWSMYTHSLRTKTVSYRKSAQIRHTKTKKHIYENGFILNDFEGNISRKCFFTVRAFIHAMAPSLYTG